MLRLNQSWVKVGEIVFFDMIYMIFRIPEVTDRHTNLSQICKLVKPVHVRAILAVERNPIVNTVNPL